jgi:hypothetical protein
MILSMDRRPDSRRITWCEVIQKPTDPVLGLDVENPCSNPPFAFEKALVGGFPFRYIVDIVATPKG